jgi:hypothetical protein
MTTWGWMHTTRGKRMLKGITLGTVATLVTIFAAWSGTVFGYAQLSERVERSRVDITELQTTVKEQTNILHKIDTTISIVDARINEHMKQTQR